MSEKTNDDADGSSPLRPVDSTSSGSDDAADAPGWMQSLGVSGSSPEPVAPAPAEPSHDTSDQPWMDQLGGTDPSPSPSETHGGGSTWAEPVEPGERRRRPTWAVPVLLVVVLVVFVAGVGVLVATQMSSGTDERTNLAAELDKMEAESAEIADLTTTAAAPATAAFECKESDSGDTVTGAGTGDTKSVDGVVLAFEDAYYNERDAKKALSLTSKDSLMVDAKALQEGIDSVPRGTEYCVSITADGDEARVEITEARPSAAPETFTQTITTSRDGKRVEIVSIADEEG